MVDMPPFWLAGFLLSVLVFALVVPDVTWPHVALRIAGAVLVLAGIALMLWAVAHFRRHNTSVVPHQLPDRIITTGPFARSRNPIYLGDVLVLIGVILWQGAFVCLVLVPVFMAILLRRFIAPEEARMKQNFAGEYDAYTEITPRWL